MRHTYESCWALVDVCVRSLGQAGESVVVVVVATEAAMAVSGVDATG
jgi:hypothetical protein